LRTERDATQLYTAPQPSQEFQDTACISWRFAIKTNEHFPNNRIPGLYLKEIVCVFPDEMMTTLADRSALILVVERNPLVQRLEKYFLEQAGYSVEFAADGLTALERARELRPVILVTEVLVPKLDGLSLCRQLKSDPSTQEMKVLIFSHLHAEERAREAGADAFLIKPLNEERLIDTVAKLIEEMGQQVAAGEQN
jgi:CheY-like chemotaxis protein